MKFKYLLLIFVLMFILTGCVGKEIILENESDVILEIGDEKVIEYEVKGSDEDTYLKSSNDEIVSINENKIKAVSEGTININIYFKGDEKSYASFKVIVNSTTIDKNITTNYTDMITIEVDEEKILEYESVGGTSDVVLTTDKPDVLSIEGNKIIGKKTGTAVISFSFANESYIYVNIDVEVVDKKDIVCSSDLINLEVLDEYNLLYEVINSEEEVVLVSDNPEIVKIEGDTLIALNVGEATISLKFVGDDKIYKTVEVIVKGKPLVKEINIAEDNISLFIGDEYLVSYVVVNSDENVVMVSSNPDVVSVVDDKLIANSTGEASISLMLAGDDKVYNNINVVVSEPEKKIEILNEETELSLFTTLQVVLHLEYVNEVVYESSNPEVAIVSIDGLIEALKEGEFILYVKDANDEGVSISMPLTVKVDPFVILDMAHIERPITQYVSSYGYNPDVRYQWVYGSVSAYSTMSLNLVENIVDITENIYQRTTATEEKLTIAEEMKLVRSGILHEKTEYITYHDTGNHTPGANALMHANYMVGADNKNNRARSWHYTVDENQVIHHIPDNEVAWQGDSYIAYARSIGVETCVDFGSDLYKTWQRTGKLMAGLLFQHDLKLDAVKQHYDWSQKNCPQTLRRNNLYDLALSMIEAEYNVLKYLEGYDIEYVSLNPEYIDNTGKVIKLPSKPIRVGYKAIVTSPSGNVSEKVYYSYLKLEDGSTLTPSIEDIELANSFDNQVWAIDDISYNIIDPLISDYQSYSKVVKELIISYPLLQSYEISLMEKDSVDTPILIYEVLPDNNTYKINNSYIMLYNTTNSDFSLKDKYLIAYNNTTNFSLDGLVENKDWYKFSDDMLIKANSYFLIQTSINVSDEYPPLADAVVDLDISFNLVLVLADELKDISEKQDIVIDLLVTNNEVIIGNPITFDNEASAIGRKYFIDTNDCKRDFQIKDPNPINSQKQSVKELTVMETQALIFDTYVRFLDRDLTVADEGDINYLISLYEGLTNELMNLIVLEDLYNNIIMRWNVVNNPDLKVISDAVIQIPNQIINDFVLPSYEGLTYSYGEDQDSSYFNLETGEYLKISYEYNPIIIRLSYNNLTHDLLINFGVARDDETVIYATGLKATAFEGSTANGGGTYEEQAKTIGFGNVVIKVDKKVYIIGEKAYIPVIGTCIMNELGIAELRPYGSSSDTTATYNQGLIKGVPTAYSGSGALYENISDAILSFDPSNTYGRNNSGNYGYFKVIFSKNSDGSYIVSQIVSNSGTNTTTNNDKISLEPDQILWAPHTYETNVTSGTWLMNGGLNGSVGVLTIGKQIEVIKLNK